MNLSTDQLLDDGMNLTKADFGEDTSKKPALHNLKFTNSYSFKTNIKGIERHQYLGEISSWRFDKVVVVLSLAMPGP